MIFGNRSVVLHLARGVIGFGALAFMLTQSGWWSVALLPVALLALKGCPVCWMIGLFETVAMRVHGGVEKMHPIPLLSD